MSQDLVGDSVGESGSPEAVTAESSTSATTRPMVKRILVPLDMNRLSEAKIPTSEAQARAFGAEIILLHVIPSAPPAGEDVTVTESQALSHLQAIATRLRSEGIAAHSLVRYGPVAQTIVNEIAAQKADLVVLGANVRRGFSRLLLGNVAEEIIAMATCPVLVVRPDLATAARTQPVRSFTDDVARTGPVAPRELGSRTVDAARIIGSVGRASELDEHFRVQARSRIEEQRYDRILHAMENGESLPPVVLYKLGYGYYVLDGNHRVAAARQLGVVEIDADVTEFVPLSDPLAQRVFAERRAFERSTGLNRIGAAQPGHYPVLYDLIRGFGQEHGIEDVREAARRWETDVYRLVARRIRALRLSQYFVDQRTADIFVNLWRFREELAKREGRSVTIEEALSYFQATRGGQDG